MRLLGLLTGGGGDPQSSGAISNVVKAGAGTISFDFPDGTTFDVEYSTDLEAWQVIANDVTGNFEDSNPGRNRAATGYYRGVVK